MFLSLLNALVLPQPRPATAGVVQIIGSLPRPYCSTKCTILPPILSSLILASVHDKLTAHRRLGERSAADPYLDYMQP